MANSKYEYIREYEDSTDIKLPRDTFVIMRLDGQNFHQFTEDHNFSKPNDKRALDLMVSAAKHVMDTYRKHIPLAFGHSDEFSFLLKSKSNLMQRRYCKLTSLIASTFTSYYVYKWNDHFQGEQPNDTDIRKESQRKLDKKEDLKHPPSFDARPVVYSNRNLVMDYFKWRQVDCHINNLYNTTLNAMTGRYVKHELRAISIPIKVPHPSFRLYDHWSGDITSAKYELIKTPISAWVTDEEGNKFMKSTEATQKLSGTLSSDKHDIMFLQYGINYNNELEQFKKGTFIVNTMKPDDFEQNPHPREYLKIMSVDAVRSDKFWQQFSYIFDD